MARKAALTRRRNYGNGHGYYLDGAKLEGRGVTTILSNGVPKNGLQYWAAKEVATCAVDERDIWEPLADRARNAAWEYLKEAPFRDRDAAARRGTDVHRIAEQLGHGEVVEVPEPLIGHVDSYIEFLADFEPVDTIIEGVVINRTHRYMGTFDLIGTLNGWPGGPRRILADIKTARSGVYLETALQLAGYRFAETYLPDPDGQCDEEPMPEVEGCAVIHVRSDGYEVIPVDAGLRAFRTFQYVDQVAQALGTFKDPGWLAGLLGDPVTPDREKATA